MNNKEMFHPSLWGRTYGTKLKKIKHEKTIQNLVWFFLTWNEQFWSRNLQVCKISANFARQSRWYDRLKKIIPWVTYLPYNLLPSSFVSRLITHNGKHLSTLNSSGDLSLPWQKHTRIAKNGQFICWQRTRSQLTSN